MVRLPEMTSRLERPPLVTRVRLYSRIFRRAAARHGLHPVRAIGRVAEDPVFVVGCPRSGTTFTAAALGAIPGFIDLGETNRLKAVVPELYRAVGAGAGSAVVVELRRVMVNSQRAAMAVRRRGIEQTPETTFLIGQLAQAFPRSHFVHVLRDGRDVAASLIERGWLAGNPGEFVAARAGGEPVDAAGHKFGGYARFWVEPDRGPEFEHASEPRRCAWAWRRYVGAALTALDTLPPERVTTIRYERLVAHPEDEARRVADELGASAWVSPLREAMSKAHRNSVARYEQRLGVHGLADVEAEAGSLLTSLGYQLSRPER